jgi:hypothetical protein
MRGQQVVDVTAEGHSARHQNDQMVAHPFDVADQMRRQQHHHAPSCHDLHQGLQELPSCQRIEVGDRLVEHEQLGPLGEGHRQRELGALAARQGSGALAGVESERLEAAQREVVVPTQVQPIPHSQVLLDGQARVDG